MTKTVAILLGAGIVVLVIVIALLVRNGCREPSPKSRVEIVAPKGTQIYARFLDESEQHLGDVVEASLTVDVAVDATIILRFKDREKTFPPEKWRDVKLIEDFDDTDERRRAPPVVTVSINAVPWAEVFIKLPKEQSFIKPQREHFTIPPDPTAKTPNVTPIRGGLKVPVGTAIRLVYEDKEKTFEYVTWNTSKTISHDFLNP